MRFEDYPVNLIATEVFEALDMIQSDIVSGDIKVCFFDRLRSALKYLGIAPEPIKELNFGNYSEYYYAVCQLIDAVFDKYQKEIESVYNSPDLRNCLLTIDLLGYGIGKFIELDEEQKLCTKMK